MGVMRREDAVQGAAGTFCALPMNAGTAACETSFNINFLPSFKKRIGKSRRA